MSKQIVLHHVGSKRGGYNVRWYLQTGSRSDWILPKEEALKLGFKYDNSWDEKCYLGPFESKDEALCKAKELGLECISPQKFFKNKTKLPSKKSQEMGEYDNPPNGCPNCGRFRIMRGKDGKHRCEKCAWCIEDSTYDSELLNYIRGVSS